MSEQSQDKHVIVGRITSVYGVKGMVKVFSHTEPMENILNYSPWMLKLDGRWTEVKLAEGRRHGKGIVVRLAGCSDRDVARKYCEMDIAVSSALIPELEEGEFYWSQLENLTVYTVSGQLLGKVSHLMETGANDVLVVKGNDESIDRNERLIPYLPDQVIKEIDLVTGTIRVDWDPEF
jgi:16S rRNA processing protein RimM